MHLLSSNISRITYNKEDPMSRSKEANYVIQLKPNQHLCRCKSYQIGKLFIMPFWILMNTQTVHDCKSSVSTVNNYEIN